MFPDPSLTPENLSTVLDSMSDEQWWRFREFANIPLSELERISGQYSSERERKQAVIHSLTSTHPALSWTRVAYALYWTAWEQNDESCLRALDRLQQLFPIGTCICMYMYILYMHNVCRCIYMCTTVMKALKCITLGVIYCCHIQYYVVCI